MKASAPVARECSECGCPASTITKREPWDAGHLVSRRCDHCGEPWTEYQREDVKQAPRATSRKGTLPTFTEVETRCPKCGSTETLTTTTKRIGAGRKRWKECKRCATKWTTLVSYQNLPINSGS